MRPLSSWSKVLFVVAVACAKTAADGESPSNSSAVADAADSFVPEAGSGCPSTAEGLSKMMPCSIGKVCKYYDGCIGMKGSISVYTCLEGFEQPLRWHYSPHPCDSEKGPDGCPLGGIGSPPCDTPGLTCDYRRCSTDGKVGAVVHYVCERPESDPPEWRTLPKTPCSGDGGL